MDTLAPRGAAGVVAATLAIWGLLVVEDVAARSGAQASHQAVAVPAGAGHGVQVPKKDTRPAEAAPHTSAAPAPTPATATGSGGGHSAPAATGHVGAPSGTGPAARAQKAGEAADRSPVEDAVKRIKAILATPSDQPVSRPAASGRHSAPRPTRPAPRKAQSRAVLKWDAALTRRGIGLTWDSDLMPGAAWARADFGVRLIWPDYLPLP